MQDAANIQTRIRDLNTEVDKLEKDIQKKQEKLDNLNKSIEDKKKISLS